MEAVPRLPMISFHLKLSPEPTSFGPKLKQYIRDFYNEDGESYANEIHQFESLRGIAVRPPIDVNGCSLLKKYYCQLHFLQNRFPMEKDEVASVTFTWKDTYANMVISLNDIRFETMSVLYNVGAMHTQLGAQTERTTADGMKMACAHFQCAAWAFEHLKNSYPQPPGVDLAPELMTFMHQLCLAQAQECILEKSMLDNRKPTIVAKVARQIVDYYTLALSTLEQGGSEESTVSDTVGTKIYKSWKRYVKFKRAYHLAVTQFYQGLAAEEQQKMGERVAFYNASLTALNEARALYTTAKGTGITSISEEKEAIEEALTFTNDVIEGKRKAAKNENEFIYHEEVPEKESLPTVKGASLVKGTSFVVNDSEVSGPDIFARLVPMKVHEASSLYSEEKAKLLRSIGAKIEERDQQLVTYLASLKLDYLNLWDPDRHSSESDYMPLPEKLAERCAALNAKPNAIQDLVDAMGKLADTYHDVESMLKEIDHILSEEQLREKQYQEAVGKRPPTIVATDLTREAKKYEEAHAKASESNQALHRAMTLHVNNLRILAKPLVDLIAHIPSPKTCFSGQNDGGRKIEIETAGTRARELKRILNKVDEMRRQRSELHTQLRDGIAQDDLTRLLVTVTAESGSLNRIFAEQISKHQKLINLIEQNLAAQDNILAALTDAYAHTADTRKTVEEVLKRRELTITSLISSYDAYEDLLAKSTKGLEFYRKLETNVTKLLQRVKSTCKVQEEEREQILAQNNKASHNTSQNVDSATLENTEQTTSTGGGLKLKDYLANRQKAVPVYQNQYYDRHAGPTSATQSVAFSALKNSSLDREGRSGGVAGPAVSAAGTEFLSIDTKQPYQYYSGGYTGYYMGQQTAYNSQYTHGESTDASNVMNQSFPKSGTTNTDSMYHQAGGSTTTIEVASNAGQYMDYSALQNGETSYLSGSSAHNQYPTSTQGQYNANTGYAQYTGYSVSQMNPGYQPQSSIPSQSSLSGGYQGISSHCQNLNANMQYQTNFTQNQADSMADTERNVIQNQFATEGQSMLQQTNLSANSLLEKTKEILDQKQELQSQNILPRSNFQSVTGHNQQITTNQEGLVHSLQHQPILQPTDNITMQNYQVPLNAVNAELQIQNAVSQNYQIPFQQPRPIEIQNQQVTPQNQQIHSSQIMSTLAHHTVPEQYLQSQIAGMSIGDSSTHQSAYPVVSATASASGIHENSPYANTLQQPNVVQSIQQNYADQSQLNYTDNMAQPGVLGSQVRVNQVAQSYPNAYGSYQQNLSGHPYQQHNTSSLTTTQNYANYSNNSEIIHSHTKSTPLHGYSQNYQYPLQGHYSGSLQYQNYPQQYGSGYVDSQSGMPNTMTDSYKGHPGYAYDHTIGAYQYSSGYQDSRSTQMANVDTVALTLQQIMVSDNHEQQKSNAQYTNAGNNVVTNQTSSSQYSNQSYELPASSQAYYIAPYGIQNPGQGSSNVTETQNGFNQIYMQATNNETNTTTSPAVEKPNNNIGESKSNVDLLADLDITINHAPLVPVVHSIDKVEKEEENESDCAVESTPKDAKEQYNDGSVQLRTEEKYENLQIVWDTWYTDVQPKKDPLGDPLILQKFAIDIEKYEKFVDGLLVKTLSGATTLDIKWKEVQDFQEREAKKQSIKIAFAHSHENRVSECVPYDSTRVELSSLDVTSTYINASHVKDVTQWTPAAFIISQAPKFETFEKFWTMIWEQGSEVIACLASDSQLNGEIYWPSDEEKERTYGCFTLSLKNKVNHTTYIQRIFSIIRSEYKSERVVVHMQFVAWPSSGFPSSPGPLLAFTTDVMSEQALRRCSPRPIVVHCLIGGSLSGLFLLAAATVCHVRAGRGIVDVALVFSTLVKFRKCLVNKESLLFGYRMVLYHAQDALMKRGILSSSRSTFESFDGIKGSKTRRKMQQRHPSDDFLHNLGIGGEQVASANENSSQIASSVNFHQKVDETKAVDPLSQLDPMWSIRR